MSRHCGPNHRITAHNPSMSVMGIFRQRGTARRDYVRSTASAASGNFRETWCLIKWCLPQPGFCASSE
jgi:hypothetical protein